jgi:hypothetical protein
LTPPTGVPVDVITHCAWLLELVVGACNVLPAGHVDAAAAETDGEGGGEAMAVVEMLVPVSARTPTAAVTIVPFRTLCCHSFFGIRTSSPHFASKDEQGLQEET